jgi:L-asparaginase
MPSLVLLTTGGTIAGTAASPQDNVGYRAGALNAAALMAGVPLPPGVALRAQAVAALDSKDMDTATWLSLARACHVLLDDPMVSGIVITHGTDTLEETAYLLHRVLGAHKPVVLTAAMRPATALSPDGPQNLADALAVASSSAAAGVLVAVGGQVWCGSELRKLHGYRVSAFSAGDAGPWAVVEEGRVRVFRPAPTSTPHAATARWLAGAPWPWVEVVTAHAAADARALTALLQAGVQGLVLAGTGNGTLPVAWDAAIAQAQAQGVRVLRTSRCLLGGVVAGAQAAVAADTLGAVPDAGPLTPAQARIDLALDVICSG